MNTECMYCRRNGKLIDEEKNVVVCDNCMKLLQNPITALPLIKGNLFITLRGKMSDKQLKKSIDKFMDMISSWHKDKINKN